MACAYISYEEPFVIHSKKKIELRIKGMMLYVLKIINFTNNLSCEPKMDSSLCTLREFKLQISMLRRG
jgi:hypothetical protein